MKHLDLPPRLRGRRSDADIDWAGRLDEDEGSATGRIEAFGAYDSKWSRDGMATLALLRADIESRVDGLAERWDYDDTTRPLRGALRAAVPLVTVRIPLRNEDVSEPLDVASARTVVAEAIAAHLPHAADVAVRVASLHVAVVGDYLVLRSRSGEFAVDAAEAYLSWRRPRRRPRLVPPVWAWGSATIALLSVGLSFLPLTTVTLIVLGVLTAAVVGASWWVAPSFSARRSRTLIGLSAPILLIGFACVYGGAALLEPSAFQVGSGPPHALREPLLLSLGLLTTAGFIDSGVHDWLRSVAYLEMLLFIGFAGGAVVLIARRTSEVVGEAVTELRREREG